MGNRIDLNRIVIGDKTEYQKYHFSFSCALWKFLKKILEDMSPFRGTTDTPVLDFWWRLPWVSMPGWIPCLHALSPAHNGFPRFTSGATPADPLTASMGRGIFNRILFKEWSAWCRSVLIQFNILTSGFSESSALRVICCTPEVYCKLSHLWCNGYQTWLLISRSMVQTSQRSF